MTAALQFIQTRRGLPVAIMVAGAVILGIAYFFEHVLGILPCALCQYQRLAWWVAIGVAGISFYLRRWPVWQMTGTGLAALIVLAGGAIAGYHIGVEQGWWEGPSSCTSSAFGTNDIDALRSAIMAAPVIRCDDVAWSLFGISMAGYNLLLALFVGGAALYGLRRVGAGRPA